jgi:hypothetical protein
VPVADSADEPAYGPARRWPHVQDYADAKTPIVDEIVARASRQAAGLT